jgi:hypothetical protein
MSAPMQGWSGFTRVVQDTHQRAAISTFREGALRNSDQGPVAQETQIGVPFFGIAKSKRPSRVLAAVNQSVKRCLVLVDEFSDRAQTLYLRSRDLSKI